MGRLSWLVTVLGLLLVAAAACASSGNTAREDAPPAASSFGSPESVPVPELFLEPIAPPPPVDKSTHSVPLENVVFDTFDGRFVRLSEASTATIERLRDAIRPIYQPLYDGPEGADWLGPEDTVLGYVGESGAYAYPIRMLNTHELVNDVIDGLPVIITYCPLCASGVVYDRRVDGQALVFGNTSALFENDLVMYDHQTGSYWFQVGGKAIVGTLTGEQLVVLPSVTLPWGQWLELHPETKVLSLDQTFERVYAYGRDYFPDVRRLANNDRFSFPLSRDKIDDRLRLGTVVLTVRTGDDDTEKAYPLDLLGDAVVNDSITGQEIVVFSRASGPAGIAFSRRLGDGRVLTFDPSEDAGTTARDRETGSRWDFFGRAINGPLSGQKLTPLPTRRAFWFAISLALPNIEVFEPAS